MSEKERILLECRYLLSINKTYVDLANHLNIPANIVFTDLNYKLKNMDSELYYRVKKRLKRINNS